MKPVDYLGLILVLCGTLMTLTGIGALIGVPLVAIGILLVVGNQLIGGLIYLIDAWRGAPGGQPRANGQTASSGPFFDGREYDTVGPQSFVHYDFTIEEPAVLDYGVEVFNGPAVNTIVTTRRHFERFKHTPDIKHLEKGSRFATTKDRVKAHVSPSDYVLIVDNTGRMNGAPGNVAADIEFDYQVYA